MPSDQYADVCVIGAGISGLTTAYLLLRAGKSVIVIDRETQLGLHETGLTSAHLSNALDDTYQSLIQHHGLTNAQLAADSHTEAINMIEKICTNENIDCDFKRVDGYLFTGPEHDREYLQKEMIAAEKAGLKDLEILENVPVNFFHSGACLRYPNQAQFHAIKYLNGLAEAVAKMGGKIFTRSEATQVVGGRGAYVKLNNNFCVHCNDIVVATNVPFNDRISMQTKIAAYRSYVIGVAVPKNFMKPLLLWDTTDPYHYIRLIERPESSSDLLIVGGEDHRTGHEENPQRCFRRLMDWVQDTLLVDGPVECRWSGQIIEPFDGPAFIGRNPGEENVYIVTGDSGHGLTHGTIGGMLICDLILKVDNPWENLYNPSRFNISSVGNYLSEVSSSTAPYKDWLSPAEVSNIEDIPLGEGAIVRRGLKKLAVYKDSQDHVKIFSAICPHLGGIVRWNDGEKTWDCPCHGSRFTTDGKVVNGPAPCGLHAEDGSTAVEEAPVHKPRVHNP